MKKALFTLAVLCYFAAASGVVISTHYCMKKLVSVKLFGGKSNECGRCGMKMHKNSRCCHDEEKVLKLEQDQNRFSVINYDIPALESLLVSPSDYIASSFYNFLCQRHNHNHSPPLLSEQDTYLYINVFRI
jgi:hypothetical protein